MIADPGALVGFADSGAHIRNMAFYSFPLRMLRHVVERQTMPLERAVWRLTGELGDWLGVEAGHLRVGDRADLVVIDPAGSTRGSTPTTRRRWRASRAWCGW
jgi:N-acyl-D-aspartate/D-glutamate deacylase